MPELRIAGLPQVYVWRTGLSILTVGFPQSNPQTCPSTANPARAPQDALVVAR